MKLSLVLNQLRHGGLRQVTEDDKTDAVVVNHINMAILKLYGRFPLEMKEAIITLRDDKVLYTLASTDTDVLVDGAPVVDETVGPILNVFNEAGEVDINNEYNDFSVFTPTYNTIQIPTATTGNYISVLYRANPEWIVFTDGDDSSLIDIKLPMVLLEPLLYYTSYLVHSSQISGLDTEGHSYYMKYEASCKRLENEGLLSTDSSEINTNANEKGGFL